MVEGIGYAIVIVAMLALSARESWERLATANRIAGVANVSGYMFEALNALRVDRFSTTRDLAGERQFPNMDPLVQNARDKEMPALQGLVTALASSFRLSASTTPRNWLVPTADERARK